MPPLFFEIDNEEFNYQTENRRSEALSAGEIRRLANRFANLSFVIDDNANYFLRIFSNSVIKYLVKKQSDCYFLVYTYPRNGKTYKFHQCDEIEGLFEYLNEVEN